MPSSAGELDRLKRDLAAIQGVLALSMLMVDVGTEAEILALASSAIGTVPGAALLAVVGEDGHSLRNCPTRASHRALAVLDAAAVAAGGTVTVDGRAARPIPLRTHRARLGYLLVPEAAATDGHRFLLEAIAHEVAVAISACEQRATLRAQARRLAASEARYRDLAERSPDAIWHIAFDPETAGPDAAQPAGEEPGAGGHVHARVDYVSPAFEGLSGVAPEAVLGDARALLGVIDPERSSQVSGEVLGGRRPRAARNERFFSTLRRPDGTSVVVETQVAVTPSGAQGIMRDMTEIGRLQAELTELAVRDPLTGLANRRLLDELLGTALDRSKRTGEPVAVAVLDLDRFKAVNDTYGHAAGDEVLRQTATRLRAAVRASDVVARTGGDEFVVVFDRAAGSVDAVLARIEAVLAAPIDIGGGRLVDCPASVGVADTRATGPDPSALLATADAVMYAHKHR